MREFQGTGLPVASPGQSRLGYPGSPRKALGHDPPVGTACLNRVVRSRLVGRPEECQAGQIWARARSPAGFGIEVRSGGIWEAVLAWLPVRHAAIRAGRSSIADTTIPPTRAQNAGPIPRMVKPEPAMTRAKNAPRKRSVFVAFCNASIIELISAKPANAGTSPGGSKPRSDPAVAAHRASTTAIAEAITLATYRCSRGPASGPLRIAAPLFWIDET